MMRAIESDNFADFADIYEPDVELVSVTPPGATAALDIAALARHSIKARWSQTAGNEDITAEQVKRAVDGVVHRSPHYRGDRLLVSIDPIFEGPDA